MKLVRALPVLFVAVTGCTAQVSDPTPPASPPTTNTGDVQPTGKGTTKGLAHNHGGGGGGNGISYHGGPLMLGTPNVYYIWYGNWGGNSATTILPALIPALSGSSYEHINTTYYNGSNQHVAGTMNLAGQVDDSYSQGSSLSDNGVQAVVEGQIAGGHLPEDTNAIYFVLTSADVKESSGFCTQYCGWHWYYTRNDGSVIKYSFVGNPDQCPSACEDQTSSSPNGNTGADGMASIMAHESEEAISDPQGNAWYDYRGNENADKCAWTFGTTSRASNGSLYNFTGDGRQWLIQQNWVNASGGYCAMSY